LLAEAEEIARAGSVNQLAFSFAQPLVETESPAQRLAWERRVLGQPLSVHPLELVADRLPEHTPLRQLPAGPTGQVVVAGARLPGWTGGRGFFLGDGETFVVVQGLEPPPPVWDPLVIRGRWVEDAWGTLWLAADKVVWQRETRS
jgi:hypothetical protein